MTKPATDRRIVRTRAMLQDALISLILMKGYEAITITDICEAANVGRSTFYAHFTGKDDLKCSGLEHLRRALFDRQRASLATTVEGKRQPLNFSLALFAHARYHLDLYRALAGGRGGAVALANIGEIVADLVRDELAATSEKDSGVPRELIIQYVVGAYMAVLTWWLDRGAKLPPEQVDAMFRRLATEGVLPSHS